MARRHQDHAPVENPRPGGEFVQAGVGLVRLAVERATPEQGPALS